ncbi:hypothetical protein KC725_05145 [Candidatus Peregrinibacteria bacterium]|nr:hypothetical protein [Candidatus Peregrinibacteria bacterium]
MDKKSKTILLVALIFVFGVVALYAASSGSGSLFQGALRSTYNLESTDSTTGVSRTATTIKEEDPIRQEEIDLNGTLTTTSEPSTTITAREEEDLEYSTTLSASAEDDPIRQEVTDLTGTLTTIAEPSNTINAQAEEEFEFNTTLSASAEDDSIRQTEENSMTAEQINSVSNTIDASEEVTISATALQSPDPECPSQSYMVYGSTFENDYQAAVNQINANPAGCSYRFVLNSPGVQDVITCASGELAVFNNQIKCDQILSQGSLHASLTVLENEARYSHRFNQGETYRNHVTSDFAIWVVGTNG